ncbi:hypothetical protein [Dictyobacter aurantiacus]|uniref:Uncharacterized protein n=1 Tax=Dictyobacter aurantiacus TaxID=1936993 RepID=A0A401ZFV3_9CHLR|nr:hypothetical protein [Dictyobacter aurantiacus]GCE05755.1 hypothetical protein KDAU_30840 [Dictyobacter aurantiacus]
MDEHMTQQQYVQAVLTLACAVLRLQGVNLFEATIEQAWDAFSIGLARDPFAPVARFHTIYGSMLHSQFALLWPAFQYELACNVGVIGQGQETWLGGTA